MSASIAARLWQYQAERFPVFKHGLLIAAFGASAVCLSALLDGGAPKWEAILVAILVLFGFFAQLRIADEHKDNAEDTKFRPERPVPRGLVTLKELRLVAIVIAVAQLGLTAWLSIPLIGLLLLVWAWMALMGREFFAHKFLRARPILYMISHMLVMPLIDLYATACDWMPAGAKPEGLFAVALAAFLALSLTNGVTLEIARKSWAPDQEREGVDTYSKLWRPGRAGGAVAEVMFVGFCLSAAINAMSGASVIFLALLVMSAGYSVWRAIEYADAPSVKSAKSLETAAGLYILANYLLLGVAPLVVQQVFG